MIRISTNDVVQLLESYWQDIQRNLGNQWHEFLSEYKEIVRPLQEKQSREGLEHATDAVCELMQRYDYTHNLLRNWQVLHNTRHPNSAEQTLDEEEQVRQICNRLVMLGEPKESHWGENESRTKNKRSGRAENSTA